jgi:hypothetical protein
MIMSILLPFQKENISLEFTFCLLFVLHLQNAPNYPLPCHRPRGDKCTHSDHSAFGHNGLLARKRRPVVRALRVRRWTDGTELVRAMKTTDENQTRTHRLH